MAHCQKRHCNVYQSLPSYYNNANYYSYDNTRCAIGKLIPRQNYQQAIEGLPVTNQRVLSSLRSEIDTNDPEVVDLLQELQNIHDDYDRQHWRDQLLMLARERGLDTNFLISSWAFRNYYR